MTGIDACQRKIIFPPRFVPYLEKHRIFELFHELTELLIQERPKDHVTFLREVLPCAVKRRDKPRIVFIAPPSFDRTRFAKDVANILGINSYTRYYIKMKDRERRLLEWLKREEAMKKPTEEEYSCVCPEYYPGEHIEGYVGEFFGESVNHEASYEESELCEEESESKPSIEEEKMKSPTVPLEEEEEEEQQQGEEEGEDPCGGYRVCPCKKTDVGREDPETNELSELEESKDEPQDKLSKEQSESKESETKTETIETSDRIPREIIACKTTETTNETSTEMTCVCESEESDINFGMLGSCEYYEKGWILVDFPKNAEEAELLCEQGAIPTHAVRLITGGEDEKTRHYKYLSEDWAAVYRSVPVMDIHVNGRSASQLARDLSKLLKMMPHRHAPMIPRIILIGSRGSGATTQGTLLAQKYKMVHVEFKEEMARVILRQDKFSEAYRRQLLTRPDPELEAAILEKILLSPRCRRRGWVLTGYPTNTDQLRMLDLMATPPNRIIFLEVPAKECFIRLYYRKTDWTDGKEYKIPALEGFDVEGVDPTGVEPDVKDRLLRHPRDDRRQIIRDIEQYFEEKEEMMKYCGKTAAYVNGNKSVDSVFELIDDIIIKPSPAEPPRNPLAVGHGIEEAYERWQTMRMDTGINHNNLLLNPPNPIFKF